LNERLTRLTNLKISLYNFIDEQDWDFPNLTGYMEYFISQDYENAESTFVLDLEDFEEESKY